MAKGRSIVKLQTNLRDLKYRDFAPGSAPYVSKDIGSDIHAEQKKGAGFVQGAVKEATARFDDVVRISKFIASGKGLVWEGKQIALEGLQTVLDGKKVAPQKGWIGEALKVVGNTLAGALQLNTATLAQVGAGDVGYHHETYQSRAYLQTGGSNTVFNQIISTIGLANDKSLISGAQLAKSGGEVHVHNPRYSLLGGEPVDGPRKETGKKDDPQTTSRAIKDREGKRQPIVKARSKYSPKGDSWYDVQTAPKNYNPVLGSNGERYTRQQPYLANNQQIRPDGEVGESRITTVIGVLSESTGSVVEVDLGTKLEQDGINSTTIALPEVAKAKAKLEGPEKAMLDPGEVNNFKAHNGHSWTNKQEFTSGSKTSWNPGTYSEWIGKNSGSQKLTYSVASLEQQLPGSVESVTRGVAKVNGDAKDFHGNVVKYHEIAYPGVTDYTIGEENPAEEVNPSDEVLKNFINHIPFQFCLVTPETRRYMHFKANLENFSDDYTGNWEETQYVGRADKFYTYSGFGREISFAFKVAAFTQSNLVPMYRNLQTLAASVAPTYGEGGVFMRGTIGQVTIGDYLVRQYGIFKSVKLSWKTEYPWEIDKKQFRVPHILDVSVSFTPIHNFIPESLVDFTKEMYFGNKNKQGGL